MPGEGFATFTLTGESLYASQVEAPMADSALGFLISEGGRHLGRPSGSMILAYKGRAYARATAQEMSGRRASGGYKRVLKVDGVRRLQVVGVLTLPDEPALYDIIQDHFGPASTAPH